MVSIIVSVALVVLFIGGWLVYVKWGTGKSAVIGKAFDMAAMLSSVVSSLIKNNNLKTDPHDVLVAINKVAIAGSTIVSQVSSGGTLEGNKESIKKLVMDVLGQFPELKDKVKEDMVDKEIGAALVVLSVVKK